MNFEEFFELMGKVAIGFFIGAGVFVLIILSFAAWGLIWSFPLMWAWNFVMPEIFSLPKITYWQMWALYLILSSLWKVSVHNTGGKDK